MQHDLVCHTCRGTEFYEDRQGNYTCQRCGALSQDYFAESYEVEDLMPTRGMRTIKKKSRKRDVDDIPPITPFECVAVYQECLQKLAQIVAKLINSDKLEDTVRVIWFEYLSAWQRRGWSMQGWFGRARRGGVFSATESAAEANERKRRSVGRPAMAAKRPPPMFADIADSSSDSEAADGGAPVGAGAVAGMAPSKPLLLGFLYLACAQLRSCVIPADIVRWCAAGVLPMANLWASDCISPANRERFDTVPLSNEKKVFCDYFRTETSLPTVSNVLFNTAALADLIAVPLPPLNAPLVAWRLVAGLGLPAEVWHRYSDLAKLRGSWLAPMKGADPFREHHVENVAAAVLMACKLCPSWPLWALLREEAGPSPSPAVSFVPLRVEDIRSSLCKRDLPVFLKHLSAVPLHSALSSKPLSGKPPYNDVVVNFFAELDEENGLDDEDSDRDTGCEGPVGGWGAEGRVVWSSDRPPFPAAGPRRKQVGKSEEPETQVKSRRRGSRDPFQGELKDGIFVYPFRPKDDKSLDLSYTVLLERLARAVGCWPGDLHRLLEALEGRLCEFARPAEEGSPGSGEEESAPEDGEGPGAGADAAPDQEELDLPLSDGLFAQGGAGRKRPRLL